MMSRFESRPSHVKMTWKLLKHDPRPRIMSNRFTVYPIPGSSDRNAPSTFRQVVVRLRTRQLLTIERNDPTQAHTSNGGKRTRSLAWSPDGTAVEAKSGKEESQGDLSSMSLPFERHEQDVVEYVVLQRRMLKGVEEPWKLWGFADKTTLQRIRDDEEMQAAMNEYAAAHPEAA